MELRYNGKSTNIFVNNKQFIQCKNILLNIPKEEVLDWEQTNSIDELIYKFEGSLSSDFDNHNIKIRY